VRWISISLPKPQIPSPTVFAGALESLQMKKRKKKEVGWVLNKRKLSA
jgi:hypothetical protein